MRVHAIVWMPLVPFACRTSQWVSTAATSTLDQASYLLLAPAAGLERAPSQQSSEYRKAHECCCNQVDGAAEGCPPACPGNILAAVLPQILDSMPD